MRADNASLSAYLSRGTNASSFFLLVNALIEAMVLIRSVFASFRDDSMRSDSIVQSFSSIDMTDLSDLPAP